MTPQRRMLMIAMALCAGCTGPVLSPETPREISAVPESDTTLIGDYTRPFGMAPVKIEGISLVTGLQGSGDDPPPSPQRNAVISEMRRHNIENGEQVLASPDTALVLVRAFLRPGIQKGDRFDVEVRIPSRSEATSLRGGWLLDTRLTELAVLGGAAHQGHLLGKASGPVLVDPSADETSDRVHRTRGRVLGAGIALQSRPVGLVLMEEKQHVRVSQQIGEAINARFHTYISGSKQGVATPKTDKFIELAIHPRYKDNVSRYMRVIRNIAFRETNADMLRRIEVLEKQLLDPVSSATAALRLEAIGKEAVPSLVKGLESPETEVRFYAAEALAYLDQTEAAEPLGKIAGGVPAFRVYALAALSAMDDMAAYDELQKLLHVESAETRYGAFRALTQMNPNDSLVRGEMLGGFHYHLIDSAGPPMIHVTKSLREEVVIFGLEQRFDLPLTVEAGKHILINSTQEGELTLSRFAVGEPDQKRHVPPKVDQVVRAIVELGGRYPDIVQALQQAKESGALASRLEVDALPKTGRQYEREDDPPEKDAAPSGFSRLLAPWR